MGIEAEFQGRCRNCDDPIEPGQEIEPAGGWWRHVVCPRTAEITCSICGDKWVDCDCP
jgi:hypothetical protein